MKPDHDFFGNHQVVGILLIRTSWHRYSFVGELGRARLLKVKQKYFRQNLFRSVNITFRILALSVFCP